MQHICASQAQSACDAYSFWIFRGAWHAETRIGLADWTGVVGGVWCEFGGYPNSGTGQ
jgi:hypothetical protein